MSFTVIKSDGREEPFDENKLTGVVRRVGGTEKLAYHVIQKLKKKYKGKKVSSHELYLNVKKWLRSEQPKLARRYNLRRAILKLGPSGFDFEKYVASILRVYGYEAQLPRELQGACVTHEVDVTIAKEGRTAMIEAKFRNHPQDHINIKDGLATWARYMDLIEGARLKLCPHFDECWIVTNARFSKHVLDYGHCKNMMLIGWNHPKERSLAKMVDSQNLYPITVLEGFSRFVFKTLAAHNLLLCSELAKQNPKKIKKKLPLKSKTIDKLINQCQDIINP